MTFDMVATADTSGWTINFPNRAPIPALIVALAGDSVVTEAGPYESVIRKGVQVTTRTTLRLQDGKLAGTTVAHYATSGPDSVVSLRMGGHARAVIGGVHVKVLAVSAGGPREVEWRGRLVRTSIFKTPISDRVRVARLNIAVTSSRT